MLMMAFNRLEYLIIINWREKVLKFLQLTNTSEILLRVRKKDKVNIPKLLVAMFSMDNGTIID